MHYDWALALHHKAHPSAALNSPHYTLGLGIGDQQTKLNIVCVLKQRTFCVCVSLLKSEFTRGFFYAQDTIFLSRRPLKTIPHYFHHLCVRLIVQFKNKRTGSRWSR